MVVGVHRPTQLVIDRQALRQNIHAEVERLKDGCDLFMVVKANGYGHGAAQVAAVAREAGAKGFCVAILDEALELRAAGFNEPILVLGVTNPADAPLMATKHISATVAALDWLQAAEQYLRLAGTADVLRVHLGLDTGMGRIGFRTVADLKAAVDYLEDAQTHLLFEGIFTHFSTADDPDDAYFKGQVAKWHALVDTLPRRPRYVHVSNSATSLWHDACNDNLVRFGVAGYGLNPSGVAIPTTPYPLQPAMSLTSELVYTKRLQAGQSVSYGATYTAENDEWVGTVPIGYADGYERRLQGFHVLVDGQLCEIIGRVCMDQMMIRLPRQYARGTRVTLIGRDGNQRISLQDVADYCGTIHYEIACGFTQRVPRLYIN
ncbi:MAG TPA: alanine racemase [Candidatus Levilactobacillus faecigallinarum]|uniref:Alanine racemase n=1 Tax=Candidatus Levilactobacillus faecigallinarum TaxID=2838638 RepID=A0A9D1U4F7_9LACO|nr:alanine racemase [Candidatus Levilactobacillus faecigallinarum]